MDDGRAYPHEVLEHYRFRAIQLQMEGKQINEIAHFFGVHRGSVSRWITMYTRDGKEALKSTKAQGPSPKLNNREIANIISNLRDDATEHGFETPLWTCKRLQLIINKETGKSLHNSNVWRWLIKWGFSNQKPEKMALQANPNEGKRWLKKEWPEIKAHAKRWQAIIYFVDEAGVSLIPVMGKTWAPKGKTPTVNVTGNRKGICVTSAVSPGGRMLFRVEKGRVDAKAHIEFLKQILRHHPNRKIVVVEDRAPPHIANDVKWFVNDNRKYFALYYLPRYSPHLNPDEEVWNYLKNNKLKAHQVQTKKEFRSFVLGNMRSIQRNESLIRSFFYGLYVT
jgi:transposase